MQTCSYARVRIPEKPFATLLNATAIKPITRTFARTMDIIQQYACGGAHFGGVLPMVGAPSGLPAILPGMQGKTYSNGRHSLASCVKRWILLCKAFILNDLWDLRIAARARWTSDAPRLQVAKTPAYFPGPQRCEQPCDSRPASHFALRGWRDNETRNPG